MICASVDAPSGGGMVAPLRPVGRLLHVNNHDLSEGDGMVVDGLLGGVKIDAGLLFGGVNKFGMDVLSDATMMFRKNGLDIVAVAVGRLRVSHDLMGVVDELLGGVGNFGMAVSDATMVILKKVHHAMVTVGGWYYHYGTDADEGNDMALYLLTAILVVLFSILPELFAVRSVKKEPAAEKVGEEVVDHDVVYRVELRGILKKSKYSRKKYADPAGSQMVTMKVLPPPKPYTMGHTPVNSNGVRFAVGTKPGPTFEGRPVRNPRSGNAIKADEHFPGGRCNGYVQMTNEDGERSIVPEKNLAPSHN
ncbi:MAG: hypothetical protein SGARI_002186, partial [Bacillariaceae sp.]